MSRALVLAGTPQQFVNFTHAFGEGFRQILHEQDLAEAAAEPGRKLVLLVGTWVNNPLGAAVLEWVNELDRDGRPRGQCFTMLGRPKR